MATFTVTNLFDSGTGSFRQAIFNANTQAGVDEIIFDTGGVPSTITLTSGALNIADSVNILGPGANLLTVSGNNNSRIFNINNRGSDILDVLISGLTLTNGNATSSGGAIFNAGDLKIVNSTISGNRVEGSDSVYNYYYNYYDNFGFGYYTDAGDGSGGGIYNSGELTITNSIIRDNTVYGGDSFKPNPGNGNGGGIFNSSGSLEVNNSIISGNRAFGGYSEYTSGTGNGGGIFNRSGDVTLNSSTISSNGAFGGVGFGGGGTADGGGIVNSSGDLVVTNSTITDNRVEGGSAVLGNTGNSYGGGISGEVTVIDSTISSNTAKGGDGFSGAANGYGGGISGQVTVINSTISGNTAKGGNCYYGNPGNGFGGGIWGSGTLTNSTITGNTAKGGSGYGYICYYYSSGIGIGSGIVNTDTITITGSIVAGNANADDIAGGFTSGGNNLIGINPLLSPLQNNGGSTETHALLPGSPAIDAGSNPLGLLTDQRGSGFNRTVGSQTDIGAFEVQQPPSTSVPEPSSMLGLIGLVVIGTGSLLRRKLQNKL